MISIKDFLNQLDTKVAKEAIENVRTVLHFDISGDLGGLYTLRIDQGVIGVEEGLIGDAKSTIRTSDVVFNDLLSRKSNPMMALMTGKLKVSNPGEIMKYVKLLGLM
ncbi:MAG: SCP2 sterol-binding domain-containing protein [Bacteroidetes bacterium]|jgi:putative sterol carrier protein|nr:SCP2 sterol-binding domain-containing protein [Bacteroidota bacterium]MCO5276823.1 SCP2 sterol-binding domain-containing protein [Saprospiraceae bacterium]HMT76997.1 SCP2 sterol-binding domain-containing protein [Saprospiraceae bacterium]HQW94802.1 SCP2 sterol-binding domain-containing protein [Saprospiraceae bacterium]HRG44425.1 SCP2 sterol-binding domain-containing protein [Saprospiraceae bacterium]